MECYVYWLHLPEHTDIFSQGYVGVSIEPEKRFIQHLSDARTLKHCNEHLRRAVEKYGESIQFSILLVGDENYCYEIESKLRPRIRTGWNIAEGGGRPPYENLRGIALSEEVKQRMRKPKTKDHVENIRKAKLGNKNPMFGKSRSKSTLEKFSNSMSKTWKVTNPEGREIIVKNLNRFCQENNLDQPSMNRVSSGQRSHHKQWRCEKINE